MNPFRVILLVLLTLSLVMMFYIVAIYTPQQKVDYQEYQSMNYISQLQGKRAEHEKRMRSLAPQAEKGSAASELSEAQREAKRADAEQQRKLLEAEERRVIAGARAQEEQAQAPNVNMAEVGLGSSGAIAAHDAKDADLEQLATVVSYDANWGVLSIAPVKGKTMRAQDYTGKRIMVKRNHGLICEAVIQSSDEKTGRIVADVEQHTLNPVAKVVPQAGDKVYLSNLSNVRSQSGAPATGAGAGSSSVPAFPTIPGDAESKKLDEVEMPLVPTAV